MRSHLDGSPLGPEHSRGNIVRPQGYKPEGAHGDVVDPREDPSLSRRKAGGSLGDIDGAADPRGQHVNAEHVPGNWRAGSTTQYAGQELPHNDYGGNGFYGSAARVSLADLERVDRANGTYDGAAVPPRPQAQQQRQQLQPGAYQLQDGTILLVNNQGQRSRVTPEQYHRLMHAGQLQQAAQQAPPQQQASIMGAVMNILKGQ